MVNKEYIDDNISAYSISGTPADCVKVGVAYELQVADQLPTEENDLPVEYLVTEKGVWKRQ